jgi:hypothetical protein
MEVVESLFATGGYHLKTSIKICTLIGYHIVNNLLIHPLIELIMMEITVRKIVDGQQIKSSAITEEATG